MHKSLPLRGFDPRSDSAKLDTNRCEQRGDAAPARAKSERHVFAPVEGNG